VRNLLVADALCAAFCEHVRRTACRAAVPFSCKALIPGEKKDFEFLSRAGEFERRFKRCHVLPNEVADGSNFQIEFVARGGAASSVCTVS
jgi:hypothetical protein